MQIVVIGLGSFGYKLATTLNALGGEVIAIDSNEELIEEIKSQVTQAVCLDATDESALRSVGVADVDTAIVAIAEDVQHSILVTTLLRQIGVTKVVARAVSNIHEKVLTEVGASLVLRIEEQMADYVAKSIIAPDVMKRFSFASGYSLVEIKARSSFIGKRVKDLKIRENFDLGIAALEKRIPDLDESGRSIYRMAVSSPPNPDDTVNRDDVLVVFGMDLAIQKFLEDNI